MSSFDDIPKPLTRLVRLIMRGFYSIEHRLVIDMLVRRRETKEDDLVDCLKFEKKYLRSLVQQLKQDKFINVRLIMETGLDGKSTRHNYYSINYRMFVNVVKYKIDLMRRKLETEERDLTSRASFICQSCKKTFTDLEAGEIYDTSTCQFRCSFCGGIVDEDPSVRPKADSRFVMATFNQQMEPIYTAIQESEGIKWAVLEAERNFHNSNEQYFSASQSTTNGSAVCLNGSLNISNSIPGANIPNEPLIRLVTNSKLKNLNDIHIRQNAMLNESFNINFIDESIDENAQINVDKKPDVKSEISSNFFINPEIEALLLKEECRSSNNNSMRINSFSKTSPSSSYNFTNNYQQGYNDVLNHGNFEKNGLQDEEFKDEDDDTTLGYLMINVGSSKVPINEMSDEHVQLMTPLQRKEYERLSRYIYNQIYD